MNKQEIIGRLTEYQQMVHEKTGLDCFGTILFGSQNYGLNSSNSDVDAACLVCPRHFHDPFVPFQHLMLESGEQINIYDIRAFFEGLFEGKSFFIELVYSEYFIIAPQYTGVWEELRRQRINFIKDNIGGFLQSLQENCDMNIQYFVHQVGEKNLLTKEKYCVKPVVHMVRVQNIISHILAKKFNNPYIFDGDLETIQKLREGAYDFDEAKQLLFALYKNNSINIMEQGFFYNTKQNTKNSEWLIDLIQKIIQT